MSANIGWLFYKDYFNGIDYASLDNPMNEANINKKIQNIINQTPTIKEAEVLGSTHFTATTIYPGLLLGSGNSHELPSIKGQAILGFHFDYTSGLPVIQGSSIKGVLRSTFKHSEYIQELLSDTQLNIQELESEIFNNNDIFFDATISNADDKILGDDYITPHDDALQNPTPLRFIKVLPNTTFRFDFELSNGLISKAEKVKLFQNILEDLGLGAKTNVGYGKFINFTPFKTEEEREEEKIAEELQKAEEKKQKEKDIEEAREAKEQKANEGLGELEKCKSFKDGLNVLKASFTTAKPKLDDEQKEIVLAFAKRFEKSTKPKELKVLKKYGVIL